MLPGLPRPFGRTEGSDGVLPFQTGVIVYDALFLALVEDGDTVVVAADGKLLKAREGTPYARLAHR